LTISLIPGLLFLIIVLILRPFYLVRWGELESSRLGHFAGNTELYCCERDHGINRPDKPYIDLFYQYSNVVCNQQLAKMWKRELTIVPRIFRPILVIATRSITVLNYISPIYKNHLIMISTNHDRDVLNLLDKTEQHIHFTYDEKIKGKDWLLNNNIPSNAKIILLMVRDNAYLKYETSVYHCEKHKYRDCDINNFIAVAEELANMGFYVIRMGFHVNEALNSTHPLVIDYAKNGMRNDFMDIYLSSICKFIISTGHGAEAPAAWCFRKPRVIVNQCPTGILQTWSNKDLLLTKHHILQHENRELMLSEIFSEGVGYCMVTQCYIDKHIKLKENTPNEICDITMEMVSRLDGSWNPEPEDEFLQNRFWEIFPVEVKNDSGTPIHGEIKALFGANYLRDNPVWLQ
jgi:putative glycosyltransferase (TIGR04372 family)